MSNHNGIIIFDTESTLVSEISNKTEQELFYEKLKTSHVLPDITIDAFFEMERYEDTHKYVHSTVETIMINQILRYIIPIIDNYSSIENFDTYSVMDAFKHAKGKKQLSTISSFKKNIYQNIPIKLMNDTICYVKKSVNQLYLGPHLGPQIKVSKNSNVNIIGLVIDNKMIILQNIRSNIINFIQNLQPKYMYLSGNFALIEYLSDIFYHYLVLDIKMLLHVNLESFSYLENIDDMQYILFTDKVDILDILNKITTIIQKLTSYYESHIIDLYKKGDLLHGIKSKSYPKITKNNIYNKPKEIDRELNKLLNSISELTRFDMTNYHNINLIKYGFNNMKFYDNFIKLRLLPPNSTGVRNIFNRLEINQKRLFQYREQQFIKFKEQLNLFYKKNIAFTKFKIQNLLLLDKSQLLIVNKEYEKILHQRSLHISQEEHELIQSLDQAIIDNKPSDIKKYLAEIEKKYKIPSERDQYVKNSKGINIICPHIIDKAKLYMNTYKDEIDKNYKIIESITKQYSITSSDGYFCKVCGEKLSDIMYSDDVSKDTQAEYSNINGYDTLYLTISREVSYIISNYIEFTNSSIINISTIIKNITNSIKPEINIIQSNLIKIKTLDNENSAILLNIYIYIYVFASLAQLIYTNYGNIMFKKLDMFRNRSSVGGNIFKSPYVSSGKSAIKSKPIKISSKSPKSKSPKSKSPKSKSPIIFEDDDSKQTEKKVNIKLQNTSRNKHLLQNIINDALNFIKYIKYADIKKTESISIDSIKPLFLKAYRWVLNINYVSINYSQINYFIQNYTIGYFIYGYNQYINYSKNSKKYDKLPNIYTHHLSTILGSDKKINEYFHNIQKVLGRDYQTINKELVNLDVSVFHTLVKPIPWGAEDIMQRYKYDSLLFVYEYIINNLYLENNIKRDIVENDAIKSSITFDKLLNKYSYFKEVELKGTEEFKLGTIRPFTKIQILDTFTPHNIKSNCTCLKNSSRKFIYTLIDGKKSTTKKEFTLEEITNWLENSNYSKLKEFKLWKLDRIECKCPETKEVKEIDVFYKFYSERCPKGEIHKFDNNGKCKLCTITQKIIDNKDTSYFSKYKNVYETYQRNIRKIIEKQMNFNKVKTPVIQIDLKLPKWEITNTKVIELSKLLNISVNLIYNIGFYEKNEYTDIKSGKVNLNMPDISEFEWIKKNNHMYDYYLYIVRNYYTLKNSEFMASFPEHIKEFLKKYNPIDLFKKIPMISESFLSHYKYYKNTSTPKVFANFLITSISSILLEIIKIFDKLKLNQMGMDFVKLLLNNILDFEKKLTLFTVRKFKARANTISFMDTGEVGDVIDDAEKNNDYDEVGEENDTEVMESMEFNELEDELEGDEENANPFSLDDMDIEREENDEDDIYVNVDD